MDSLKAAPRQGHRAEAIEQVSLPLWTDQGLGGCGGRFLRTMHIQQEGSKAPGPTFIALAFSDEKGASLVHWSQQLPLSILPADGPEEPSGKRQEWVSLRVGDTPRSILRCPSHSVQSDDP